MKPLLKRKLQKITLWLAISIFVLFALTYLVYVNLWPTYYKDCEMYISESAENNTMIISFFEEFPTDENLAKLDLVDFPTKLYLAAHSLEEFNDIKQKIKSKHVKDIIYWPIIGRKDGYWLSPLTRRSALQRIINETREIDILWDAELPKKRSLILTQLPYFSKNKKLIKEFFKNHKGKIYTAEHFPEKGVFSRLLESLGLSFNPNQYNNHQIKMVYSSMHNYDESFVRAEIQCGKKQFGKKFIIGLGVIATGINGNEPLLSEGLLDRDLRIAKDAGLEEVIIFRLGGLNKSYKKIMQKYT